MWTPGEWAAIVHHARKVRELGLRGGPQLARPAAALVCDTGIETFRRTVVDGPEVLHYITSMTTQTYSDALATHVAAFHKFNALRNAYRARTVDDNTFLAAKDEYEAATRVFDAAFAAEQERGE